MIRRVLCDLGLGLALATAFVAAGASARAADDPEKAIQAWDVPALRTLYYAQLATLKEKPAAGSPGSPEEFEAFLAHRSAESEASVREMFQSMREGGGGGAPGSDPTSLFDRLAAKGFRLRQASEGPKKRDPALFSYVRDEVEDEDVFRAKLFLAYEGAGRLVAPYVTVRPRASVECNLSSLPREQNANKTGAFRLRAGADGDWLRSLCPAPDACHFPALSALLFDANAKFDSSQDSDVQKLSFEAGVSPIESSLGMGVISPRRRDPNLSFFWQPTLFVDTGTTLHEGGSFEKGDAFVRLGTTVRASIHFDALMRAMGLRGTPKDEGTGEVPAFLPHLYGEWTGRWSVAHGDQFFEYFVAGAHLPFNANVSLDLTYTEGDEAPRFERVRAFEVSLGIQF